MSKIIKSWRQREVLAEMAARAVQGMEAACQFAEQDARGRVLVNTGLTKSDITHEVSARGKQVWGRIGIPKGKGHAWYWIFHELGTRRHAAHPALRPAVFNNAAQIVKLIAGGGR